MENSLSPNPRKKRLLIKGPSNTHTTSFYGDSIDSDSPKSSMQIQSRQYDGNGMPDSGGEGCSL